MPGVSKPIFPSTGNTNPDDQIVVSPSGVSVQIPAKWVGRQADNGRGIYYQAPNAVGNANVIRIMEPTTRFPNGYVRYTNEHGQSLDVNGKPADRNATHIPLDYKGEIPGWPKS